jgi:D-erythrulose 4-kinase
MEVLGMTRLFNAPDDFAREMVEGFAAASGRWVRAVPGGVVRSTAAPEPTVALVIGGGSGHYPAFGGLVGPGLAHGAAMGNLFASPSAQQVYSVAREAEQGRGVLLSYGNYAGDVLNFTQAQDRLRAEGIDARTVLVTDDIFSAPPERKDDRRGIAGDLVVFKVAGAAAEEGADIDQVERMARLANERTRSIGVAFTGCTLPGAATSLFEVPEGRMAVGLGIHGEPGIDETDVPTANGLAELLVGHLLREIPEAMSPDGARVVPILNGLGSVKYEELFVVYRAVHRLLADAGVTAVQPDVGEFCTSFDMAGCSLTLFWLDDELERLWTSPADTPAYRRGSVEGHQFVEAARPLAAPGVPEASVPEASEASRRQVPVVTRALTAVAATLDAEADRLGEIDRVAGDGDHGIGMQRGSRSAAEAALAAAGSGAGAGTVLARAGDAWADAGGGTSGAIWGVILRTIGDQLGDQDEVTGAQLGGAVQRASAAVRAFGKAEPGDKTMVDALVPFVDTFTAQVGNVTGLLPAWRAATDAAETAAEGTAQMSARRGRAKSHGDRSLGTPDPGAVSLGMVARAVLDVLAEDCRRDPS